MASILNLILAPGCQNFEKYYFKGGYVFEIFVVYAEIKTQKAQR